MATLTTMESAAAKKKSVRTIASRLRRRGFPLSSLAMSCSVVI